MAQPTSTGGYDFEENKTVAVGEPTQAVADHDTLAQNTDWARDVMTQCWAGEWQQTDNVGSERNLNRNGAFFIPIAKVSESDTETILIDVSATSNPFDATALKNRDIHICLTSSTSSGGPAYTETQALAMVPGGSSENSAYSDAAPDYEGYFYTGTGRSGPGTSPGWTNGSDDYLWVDSTTGDLMIEYASGLGTGSFYLIRGYVLILPKWVAA